MWKNGPIVTSCTSFSLHLISVMFQNFLDQLLLLNLYGIITYDSTLTFVGMKKLAFLLASCLAYKFNFINEYPKLPVTLHFHSYAKSTVP